MKKLVLLMAIVILTLCGSCSGEPAPPSVEVRPYEIEPERRETVIKEIPLNCCQCTEKQTGTYKETLTVGQTLKLGQNISVDAGGSAQIPGIGQVQVGAKITTEYGIEFAQVTSREESVSYGAGIGTNQLITITRYEVIEKGELTIRAGGQEYVSEYEFTKDFWLGQTAKDVGCPEEPEEYTTGMIMQLPPSVEVRPYEIEPERRETVIKEIPLNCCQCTEAQKGTYKETLTVGQTLKLGQNISVDEGGSAQIPGIGQVQVGAKITTEYGIEFAQVTSREESVSYRAGIGMNQLFTITRYEVIEKGELTIRAGGQEYVSEYEFTKDFWLGLTAKDVGCPEEPEEYTTGMTMQLLFIPSESGYVNEPGHGMSTYAPPSFGDTDTNVESRAFISFDLRAVPNSIVINNAMLHLPQPKIYGDPLGDLGIMTVELVWYDNSLSPEAFDSPSYLTVSASLGDPGTDFDVTDAVKLAIQQLFTRIQLRFGFSKPTDFDEEIDLYLIRTQNTLPTLEIEYTVP